nr:hypothetical protein [Novosphingobium panipatense]
MRLRWPEILALSVNGAYALFSLAGVINLIRLHLYQGNAPEPVLVSLFALLTLLWIANIARVLCPMRTNSLLQAMLNGLAIIPGLFGLLFGFIDPAGWFAAIAILPPPLVYLLARRRLKES